MYYDDACHIDGSACGSCDSKSTGTAVAISTEVVRRVRGAREGGDRTICSNKVNFSQVQNLYKQ